MSEDRHGNRILPAVLVSLGLMLAAPAQGADLSGATADQKARRILDATGVQGGLVVHLGCGGGTLTAALCANDSYLVHGLDRDAANVQKAREQIRAHSSHGTVSVALLVGNRLPYIDNLVNLVVSEDVDGVSLDEVMRVLAPRGVAYIKNDHGWMKTVKPWPNEIDEWTHYLHDAGGNAVAHDQRVAPPRRMQWLAGPRWSRHHDHMASMSALVSARGRLFYVIDEGSRASIQLPSKWRLVARDAFSGTLLWKRSIPRWNTRLWPLKSGPGYIPRRLIAVGDRVYVTLGLDAPLTALDAATGETVRTYKGSQGACEVIASDGVLYYLIDNHPLRRNRFYPKSTFIWDPKERANKELAWDEQAQPVVAARADSGEVLWRQQRRVSPLTLTAHDHHVYFHDGRKMVCLDRQTGKQVWASEPIARRQPILTGYCPRVVAVDDVVLFSGGKRLITALSAETGKQLWTTKQARSGHNSPEDMFVIDGLVWSGATASGGDSGVFTGVDLHTGRIKSQFPPDVKTYWFHQRCYPSKATDRYVLPSRTGIEFVDFRNQHWLTHHWVRGGCIYGIMPCNGLVYAPPHPCACYLESKLFGLNALAPASATRPDLRSVRDADRLRRGEAYSQPVGGSTLPGDWPTYRGDEARSGACRTGVSPALKPQWQTDLGGRLSSVVVAGGALLVASIDDHTVHALDANTGQTRWSHTVGGRVDSPPTVWHGRVLFGSADGWVYCLRADDGRLIWRFRAAPMDQRMVAMDQVESVWPVHGNVLVQNDTVYCVAGRSMFLDGGLGLIQLDPKTGKKRSEQILDDRDPATGKNLQDRVKTLTMPVALPDVLSSDGKYIYMRSQRFDLAGNRQELSPRQPTDQVGDGVHLFASTGFLDGTWFHRSYWIFGRSMVSGWGGWPQAGRYAPEGRLLVVDDSSVYGFGRKPRYLCQSSVLEYHLFAADKDVPEASIQRVLQAANRLNRENAKRRNVSVADRGARAKLPVSELSAAIYRWRTEQPPLLARAMVLAGHTLFVAGPPDLVDEEDVFRHPYDAATKARLAQEDASLAGKKGALLWAVSATDGTKLAEYQLDSPPTWDGMAAANGRLYLSTVDGKVICLGN